MRKLTANKGFLFFVSVLALVTIYAAPTERYVSLKTGPDLVDLRGTKQGQWYALTAHGFEVLDLANGESKAIVLDVKGTVPNPTFTHVFHEALAFDENSNPLILWTGLRERGIVENYIARVNSNTLRTSGNSVKLDKPIAVFSYAVSPGNDFFILGQFRATDASGLPSSFILHQFSANGTHTRSYHVPVLSDGKMSPRSWLVSGSKVFALDRALYIAFPVLNRVFEYDYWGRLQHSYDFKRAFSGKGVMFRSSFEHESKVYVDLLVGEEQPDRDGLSAVLNGKSGLFSLEEGRVVPFSEGIPTMESHGILREGTLFGRPTTAGGRHLIRVVDLAFSREKTTRRN